MCARAISDISCSPPSPPSSTSTIPKMISWGDVVGALVALRYKVRLIPYVAWRDEVMSLTHADHNALMPLVPQFSKEFEQEVGHVERYAVENARVRLGGSMRHGGIDRQVLLGVYVGYLVGVKFLPPNA